MKIPIPSFSDARPRNRLNLTLTLPNCQVTKLLVTKLLVTKLLITKLLVLKIVQLPICQVTKLLVTNLWGYQNICYQIVSNQNVVTKLCVIKNSQVVDLIVTECFLMVIPFILITNSFALLKDKELMLAEYNKLESIIFNKSR